MFYLSVSKEKKNTKDTAFIDDTKQNEMSFSNLPIIDLQSNPDEIRQSLLTACIKTGFFYLSNHGLKDSSNQMFTLAKEFFHLPLEEKLPYSINTTSYQGYSNIGIENLDSTNSQLIDEKESFKMRELELNNKELPKLFSQNENFQMLEQFFRKCYDLCMILFEYLAETLQIDRDYFTSKHQWGKKPGASLKFLHYPPTNKTKDDPYTIRAVRFNKQKKKHFFENILRVLILIMDH